MKKIFNSRIFSLVVLFIAICALLTSCIGSAKPQTVQKTVSPVEGTKFTPQQLNEAATILYNNTEARSAFIAAYRGYDVIDGSYDNFTETKEINLEAAKKVLAKYDTDTDYSELTSADVKSIVDGMKDTVELNGNRDLFATIQYYIGAFLGMITKTIGFGNYLIGICIFAIIVELLMIPLAIKQQKNSIKQANLRPKEMAIRNRYKGRNDQATQQKVAQEIQDLYQRENFNPMSGCLPMLIQLPIIMILYNIVVDPIQFVLGGTASFANSLKMFFTASQAAGGLGLTLKSTNGTIEILSQLREIDFSSLANFEFFTNSGDVFNTLSGFAGNIPSFNVGPINFGFTPSLNENFLLLVVPVLTFVVYFFSMKISKKFTYQPTQNADAPGAGCSTKMMEWYMPIVSTFFCFMVPGAVGIYWVFRSVIMTLKQFIMSKVMPIPQFTEEDYKAAERELAPSKKPQRKRKNTEGESNLDPNREKPRSLHHIDDDDEDYITFVE